MKKLIYISPFILGVSCFVVSTIAGSTVTPQGLLVEPYFFLIPIGYIFIFIGILMCLFKGASILYKKIRRA